MDDTIEIIKLLLQASTLLVSLGTAFYVQHDRRQRATVKSIEDLTKSMEKRFDSKEIRLSRLENEMSRIPNRHEYERAQELGREEIVRIHARIDEINKGIQDSQLMIGKLIGLSKGHDHD